MSDKELVEQTLNGDKTAFEDLYDKYARLVRAICYDATADMNAAQDLGQEVFLRAYRRLHTIQNADNFGAWVSGIARLAGKEWRRKKGRDRHEFDENISETPARPLDEEDERLGIMRQAMGELNDDERFALHAFYLCGQSATQARLTLEMSQSGFYKLLERARGNLGRAVKARQGAL
jgi:RNA polymerase sigma-70 factor (ECF subfamily)